MPQQAGLPLSGGHGCPESNSMRRVMWHAMCRYAAMVVDREPFLRPDLLSQQQCGLVQLPLEPPQRFVAEPFVESGR